MIEATLYTDAGCPWAYSANPALRVLEWRFRDQLRWRLVMIGLREEASEAAVRAYDPDRALTRWRVFEERYGMPFGTEAKARPSGTGRGCRAVVAAGMLDPGSEWTVFRALQIANFTSPTLFLDDAESIREALRAVPGVDADGIAERIDDADVVAEYERQQAEARSAAGTPAEAQDKTATSDGHVRFTAPSVVFRRGEDSAFAGGWQPLLSYDTVLANFAPELERVPPPESPEPLLDALPGRADDRRGRAAPRRRLRSRFPTATKPSACLLELVASGDARARSGRCRRGLERRARPHPLTTVVPSEAPRTLGATMLVEDTSAFIEQLEVAGGGPTRREAPTPGHPGTARGPAGRVGGGRRRRKRCGEMERRPRGDRRGDGKHRARAAARQARALARA